MHQQLKVRSKLLYQIHQSLQSHETIEELRHRLLLMELLSKFYKQSHDKWTLFCDVFLH